MCRKRDRLADRRPDERADDDVSRIVHAGMHARVADDCGARAQQRRERGIHARHRRRECESRSRVTGRERRRVGHRHSARFGDVGRVTIGPWAPARDLDREVDDR